MESQTKSLNNNISGMEKEGVRVANKRRAGTCESLLRLLALALTLAAAIVLGLDKQSKVVPLKIVDTLPPLNVSVSAKWHYLSAFVYFLVTNVLACSYAALSLALSQVNRGGNNSLGLIITILDTITVALLFSGVGAASAVGLIGYRGNSHLQWKKVCGVFDKFCNQVAASLVLSLIGSIVFLLLVLLRAHHTHHQK